MVKEAMRIVKIEIALQPKDQTRETVIRAVDAILNHFNCPGCGLMGVIAADLAVDPAP
jgi:hypothetical protein